MWQYSAIGVVNICNSILLLGILVIIMRTIGNDKKARYFALFLVSGFCHTTFYALSRLLTNETLAILCFKWCTVSAIALISTLMHFLHVVLGIHSKKKYLLITIDVLNATFAYAALGPIYIDFVEKFGWGLWPIPHKPLLSVYLFWWFFQVFYCLTVLYQKGVKSNIGKGKEAYLQLFIALSIGWAGGSTPWFLWYDIPVSPYFNAAIAIFTMWIGYAVFRHRLFDIQIIIRRTAIFTGLWILASTLVCVISLMIMPFFEAQGIPVIFATIISFGIFIALFRRAEIFLEQTTNKWLFHRRINYESLLTSLGGSLIKINDLDTLCATLSETLLDILNLSYFHVYVYDSEEDCYVLMSNPSEGPFVPMLYDAQDSVVSRLSKTDEILSIDFAISRILKDMLQSMRASVLIPLNSARHLIGFAVLGPKLSDQEYTQEDIRAFKAIQASITTAIENAMALEKLKHNQIALAQKEKLATVGTLASGIKHEINNPLFVILGRAEMITRHGMLRKKTDWSRDQLIEYIEKQLASIKYNADRIRDIVERLSDFSKPLDTADMASVALLPIINDSIKLLGYDSSQMLHISFNVTIDETLMVQADSRMLIQVFFNLINNAIHAMAFEGTISVNTTLTPQHVYVHVADTGEGIDKKYLPRIFDPFFTTKDTTQGTTADIKGTGLGLHLVYNYVKKMNGDITVESVKNEGTTFTVSLERST